MNIVRAKVVITLIDDDEQNTLKVITPDNKLHCEMNGFESVVVKQNAGDSYLNIVKFDNAGIMSATMPKDKIDQEI